jgi:PilZ domain-containing protein
MQDRRYSQRSRVFRNAHLVLFANTCVVDCLVQDLTARGARIRIPENLQLAKSVGMTFDRGHTIRRCRIVWRKISDAGLQFT